MSEVIDAWAAQERRAGNEDRAAEWLDLRELALPDVPAVDPYLVAERWLGLIAPVFEDHRAETWKARYILLRDINLGSLLTPCRTKKLSWYFWTYRWRRHLINASRLASSEFQTSVDGPMSVTMDTGRADRTSTGGRLSSRPNGKPPGVPRPIHTRSGRHLLRLSPSIRVHRWRECPRPGTRPVRDVDTQRSRDQLPVRVTRIRTHSKLQ